MPPRDCQAEFKGRGRLSTGTGYGSIIIVPINARQASLVWWEALVEKFTKMSRTQSKDIAERSPSAGSAGSQSLFNIYYLGQTGVDRRCTSMMPWIIEELKLKANEMNFIWLSPG